MFLVIKGVLFIARCTLLVVVIVCGIKEMRQNGYLMRKAYHDVALAGCAIGECICYGYYGFEIAPGIIALLSLSCICIMDYLPFQIYVVGDDAQAVSTFFEENHIKTSPIETFVLLTKEQDVYAAQIKQLLLASRGRLKNLFGGVLAILYKTALAIVCLYTLYLHMRDLLDYIF